jgi:hypothetical protein
LSLVLGVKYGFNASPETMLYAGRRGRWPSRPNGYRILNGKHQV